NQRGVESVEFAAVAARRAATELHPVTSRLAFQLEVISHTLDATLGYNPPTNRPAARTPDGSSALRIRSIRKKSGGAGPQTSSGARSGAGAKTTTADRPSARPSCRSADAAGRSASGAARIVP